ncbi:ABC transporter substrate-binding protein [Hydrogenophaga sp. 5NK40-0174]
MAGMGTFGVQAYAGNAISNNHINLGVSVPLTGILAGAGKAHLEGLKAVLAEVNGRGGIYGREIKLVVADDAYNPKKTAENVSAWLEKDEVFALISILGTPTTAAVAKMLEEKGVPLVGPVTGAPSLRTDAAQNIFFVRPSYGDEAKRMVQQMTGMGLQRIAIVYLDNGFGEEVKGLMAAELDKARVSTAGEYKLALDGSNGAALAQQLVADKVGAVMLATTGTANTAFMKPFRELAAAIPVAGLSVSVISSEFDKLGDAMRGYAAVSLWPDARSMKSATSRLFHASMKKAGAPEPFQTSGSSLESWLNMHMMVEGLKRAGKSPSRSSLRSALASIDSLRLGELNLGYGQSAPFVASDAIDLTIYGSGGRPVN